MAGLADALLATARPRAPAFPVRLPTSPPACPPRAQVAAANAQHAALKEAAKEFDAKAARLQRDISGAQGQVEGLVTRQAQLMEDAVVNQVGAGGVGGEG